MHQQIMDPTSIELTHLSDIGVVLDIQTQSGLVFRVLGTV